LQFPEIPSWSFLLKIADLLEFLLRIYRLVRDFRGMLSQVWGVLGRKNVREFKKKMKRNRHYLMTIKTSVSKLKKKKH
jgi:hypothetical protein